MRYFYILLVLFTNTLFAQTAPTKCSNQIIGKVVNKMNETTIPNAKIYIENSNGEIKKLIADINGNFSLQLPCDDSRYVISTVIMNFTKSSKLVFTSKKTNKKHEVILDVYPTKEFVSVNGKNRIIVNSIVFLPNETRINPNAAKDLMIVYDILDKYKDLDVEIGFHTDSRGGNDFMLKLTQSRADACADFLIKKGIDASRIRARGYGATRLLNECTKGVRCSDEKHMQNRRSEFIVSERE